MRTNLLPLLLYYSLRTLLTRLQHAHNKPTFSLFNTLCSPSSQDKVERQERGGKLNSKLGVGGYAPDCLQKVSRIHVSNLRHRTLPLSPFFFFCLSLFSFFFFSSLLRTNKQHLPSLPLLSHPLLSSPSPLPIFSSPLLSLSSPILPSSPISSSPLLLSLSSVRLSLPLYFSPLLSSSFPIPSLFSPLLSSILSSPLFFS